MKILIINEKLIEGGTEQSCLKMKNLLELYGNDVYYLTFDNEFETKIKTIENKKNIYNITVKNNLLNKLIFKPILYRKIRRVLNEILPDKVILNNIFCSPITQIKALKGYEAYQIIRDYTVVCPKSTSIKTDYNICNGYKFEKCSNNCIYHNSKIQLLLKLYITKKMEKLRKKIIKKVISPSQKLNQYLLNYGYNSCCVNNPMELKNEVLQEKQYKNNEKSYIYVGVISEIKGVYKLLDNFKQFSKNRNVKLKMIGKCSNEIDKKMLEQYLKENRKIEFLGYKTHDETIAEIKSADFIIVPSLWIENYPTTALEGMLYGTVVLGSDRGGIPEIVGKNRGILFDILDTSSILKSLEESYNMSEKQYMQIRENAYQYVINNNSFNRYYERIMSEIT